MRRAILLAGLIGGTFGNLFGVYCVGMEPAQFAESDTDDDVTQQELRHRDEFDKTIRKMLLRLKRPLPQAKVDAVIHQLTMKVIREKLHRLAFDKKHPDIYQTPEERTRAYHALDPASWTWG
jgi:hypothetical protein